MESRFCDIDTINKEDKERTIEKYGSWRIRIPQKGSRSDKFYREKRDRQICEMANKGARRKELADFFKLSEERIKKILKANGIKLRKDYDLLKNEIKAMLKIGYNPTQIMRKTGCSRAWVYKVKDGEA